MHLHKDGLIFLRDFFAIGFGALFLVLCISGALSGFISRILDWLFQRARAACPPPTKTLHRYEERIRESRSLRIFKIFLAVLALLVVVDFFLPSPVRIGVDHGLPLVSGAITAGFLLIFIGSQTWDKQIGWKKWSFWLATLTTVAFVTLLVQFLRLRDPRAFMWPMILAGIVFLWTFGTLRKIDRNAAEMRELGITKDLAQPLPEPTPVLPVPDRHKNKRRHKHH